MYTSPFLEGKACLSEACLFKNNRNISCGGDLFIKEKTYPLLSESEKLTFRHF